MKKALIPIIVILVLVAIYVGMQIAGREGEQGPLVELAYVEGWSSEVASTNLVKVILEDKMGYRCDITPVGAAAMWAAVAEGDRDGMVAAWLPTTHEDYLERFRDRVINLGPNLEGTQIGLVVPAYVTIDTIPDLALHADKFDGKIVGIGPGAGVMQKTEQAIEAYGLGDEFTLQSSSGPMMTAALMEAIEAEEWIAITGWTPHWMFARYDLKYLHDPKNVYGGKEHISTVVRQGLQEDMPEVYEFLDNFRWGPEDMAELMVMNQAGGDPETNARKWIAQHPQMVNSWLPEKYKSETAPQPAAESAGE